MLQETKSILFFTTKLLVWIGLNMILINHYNGFLPAKNNLFITIVLFNIGAAIIVFSLYFYNELINPFLFIGLFVVQWGISFLLISTRQQAFSMLSTGVAVLSILCLSSGVLLSKWYYFKKRIFLTQNVQRSLFWILFYLGIVVFLLEVMKVGYLPFVSILQSRNPAAYDSINNSLIPLLHYLVILQAVMPVIAIILHKRNVISRSSFIFVIVVAIFITLNYLSRQSILLILLSVFLYVNYYKTISLSRIILSFIALIYLFAVFGNLRSHTNTLEEANTFLKFYADIHLDTTLFDTYLNLYSSLNFNTFNKMMNLAYDQSYFGLGIYTFKPIISLTFIDRIGLVNYPVQYNSFSSLATFMADPFLDFGWIGVIIINLIYGWICGIIFNHYEQKKGAIAIVSWAVVAFCLIMLPFVNYFNNFMIWFFLIIINLFAQDEDFGLHSHL